MMQSCQQRMVWDTRRLAYCLIGMVAMGLSGCNRTERLPLEGRVTLDGQPLPKGYVRFSPAPGTPGPTAGGEIIDGKFLIAPDGGPLAGKFRVEITAMRLTGRRVLDPRTNKMTEEYAQCLPGRYNSRSELETEVSPSGPNQFQFSLTSER